MIAFFSFMCANTACVFISGIWLLLLGEWLIFIVGIGIFIASRYILFILLIPNAMFVSPPPENVKFSLSSTGLYYSDFFVIRLFLSVVYTVFVISAWSIAVLFLFAMWSNPNIVFPVYLWAYSLIAGRMYQFLILDDDMGQVLTSTIIFFAQLACLCSILLMYLYGTTLLGVISVYGIMMLICLAVIKHNHFSFLPD